MMRNRTFIKGVLVTFVVIVAFLIGCQTQAREVDIEQPVVVTPIPRFTNEVDVEQPVTTPVPSFTYITRTGAIWQVNINGHFAQGISKISVHFDGAILQEIVHYSLR